VVEDDLDVSGWRLSGFTRKKFGLVYKPGRHQGPEGKAWGTGASLTERIFDALPKEDAMVKRWGVKGADKI